MSYLLQPLRIKTLDLKNRLIMPPLATAKSAADGRVSRELLEYYQGKSAGGYISLIIIEHSYISREGKASKNQLSVAEDINIQGLRQLAATIHGNGSSAIMQINHAGARALPEITGMAAVGPSPVVNPREQNIPRELTKNDIIQIVQSFARAARRVKEAGFDGVEIHSAHGYLLNHFLSPLTNHREDEYGGNLINRLKIHLEVIKAVRDVTGEDFALSVRLGADDFMAGGITIDDSRIAAQQFEEAGVDLLNISGGMMGYNIPGLSGQGYFAPLSQAIKSAVSIPVMVTGGITEALAAEKLLAEGQADLIGVGRAILHDSDWARQAVMSLS